MEIKYKNSLDALTIYLYGEIDECSCSNVKSAIDKLFLNNCDTKRVVFDLSGVSFIDSTGIGLLIGRYKVIKDFNIPTYITGASVATEKVLQLSGLYHIMPKF